MEVAFTECVPVTDASSVGAVRRAALLAGERLDFDHIGGGELALLATEVSRNVLIHGGGGEVIVAGFRDNGTHLARILAMDRGPGIPNIGEAMTDGYSTAGTMGGGLGAMKRIASELEIFSGPGGTIVLIEVGQVSQSDDLGIAGLALPYPGERVCGDGWMFHRSAQKAVVLLVDGLGHGLGAANATHEAIDVFRRHAEEGPEEILRCVHDALRKTRGAVAAVAEIRPAEDTLLYAGVGNISSSLIDRNRSNGLISHNGTLGASAPKIQELRFKWTRDSTLIMHSDGLQTRWDLQAYAGLAVRHPALIAGILLRDFRRHRDDASIVVIKGK